MATKEQCDFFMNQYEEENDRSKELTKRSEIFLSILSIFFTAVLFKLKDIYDLIQGKNILLVMFIAALGILAVAFSLVILSIKIRRFEGVLDGNQYVNDLGDASPSNEEFFDDRIIDYIVAVERNEVTNDKKANLLLWVGYLLLAGLFSIVSFAVVLLLIK